MKILEKEEVFKLLKQESNTVSIGILAQKESQLSDYIKGVQSNVEIALRNLLTEDEMNTLDRNLKKINMNFKNSIETTKNWKIFFENKFINGMEDFFGIQVKDNPESSVILSTSDFGTRIIYIRNDISVDNISKDDINSIMLGVDLIDKAALNLELACGIKEKMIIEDSLLEENHKKSRKLKF